ncbi:MULTISPECIES: COG3650 family protein [unclassified Sphingobium]|uniref:COG3650 family protein n=1 Tax=unclassified Sphingobium TaxID=2611147 RepID=UPI001F362A26|nr:MULTISPECIES: membrane-like protein [unclassified Sphingobium]
MLFMFRYISDVILISGKEAGKFMKLWLFVASGLLLTGCGRNEDMADRPAKDLHMANTQIVEGQTTEQQPAIFSKAEAHADPEIASPPPQTVDTAPLSSETRYRALGTEPFWSVTVKGSVATLERPGKPPRHFTVSRTDDGRAIRYLADGFAMTVTEGPCSDGMSDAHWADSVALSFGEGTLKGCGGVREDF